MIQDAATHRVVVTCEDGIRDGGIGMTIADQIHEIARDVHVDVLGLPGRFIPQGKPDRILAQLGLDSEGIAATVRRCLADTGANRGEPTFRPIHTPADRASRARRDADHAVEPGKMNATDAAMHAELATIFADVHASPEVRAVVVTGEGKAFSAGGDLDWIS